MTNYTIPNLHSIFILTLYIFLASYDNKLKLINAELTENRDYTINELMNDPDNQYLGVVKESTISVQVPTPELEEDKYQYIESNGPITITPSEGYDGMEKVSAVVNVPQIQNELLQNKRIQTSGNYTVSNLMSNPVDYAGISKSSNIIVDIPELDITQISNYPISQNGTQTVPIPSGYDAVDSISLNVSVPIKILIDRISYENQTIQFSSFTKNTNSTVSVPDKYFLFNFGINSAKIRIKMYVNNSGGSTNISTYRGDGNYTYYYLGNPISSSISNYAFLRNSNNDDIIYLYDDTNTDSNAIHIELSTTYYQFVI